MSGGVVCGLQIKCGCVDANVVKCRCADVDAERLKCMLMGILMQMQISINQPLSFWHKAEKNYSIRSVKGEWAWQCAAQQPVLMFLL